VFSSDSPFSKYPSGEILKLRRYRMRKLYLMTLNPSFAKSSSSVAMLLILCSFIRAQVVASVKSYLPQVPLEFGHFFRRLPK
jgi:hypothetical protein